MDRLVLLSSLIGAILALAAELIGPVESSYVGGSCFSHLQCQLGLAGPYSECGFSRMVHLCECKENLAVPIGLGLTCGKLAGKVGDSCLDNRQCGSLAKAGASCLNFKCNCDNGYIPSEDGTKCHPPKKLGEECEDRMECPSYQEEIWGDCINGECVCVNRYVPSPDGRDCIQQEQDYCPRRGCVGHSECEDGCGGEWSYCTLYNPDRPDWNECRCKEGATFVNGNCTEVITGPK